VLPNVENAETVAERTAAQFVKAMFPFLPAYLPS
jgi:hypothetical protein